MGFKEGVEATPNLAGKWCAGLEALRAEDKPHIEAEDTRKLTGSVDVDKALQCLQPHANRWDFAIGYQHTNRDAEVVYWTELHSAHDSQVKKVIAKTLWLRDWLKGDGRQLAAFECDIVWVSSGPTRMQLTGPQRKQMAKAGLIHVGGRLRIRNKR